MNDHGDSIYTPDPDIDEPINKKKERQERKQLLNSFLKQSEAEQVSTMQKRWNQANERTQRKHLCQAKSAVSAVLEVIAPNDVEHLWKDLCKTSLTSKEIISTKDKELLEALAESYFNATHWSIRRQIVSIMASKVSYKDLMISWFKQTQQK